MRLTKEARVYFVNHITKATTWSDPRGSKKSVESNDQGNRIQSAPEIANDASLSSSEELFLVLGTLGQRLVALGVIEDTNIPTAHSVLSKAMPIFSKELSAEFDELDIILQYAITCAGIFCAACYPMHIYRLRDFR